MSRKDRSTAQPTPLLAQMVWLLRFSRALVRVPQRRQNDVARAWLDELVA